MSKRRPRLTLSIAGDLAAPGTAAYITDLEKDLEPTFNTFNVAVLTDTRRAKTVEASSGMLVVSHLTERPMDEALAAQVFGGSVSVAAELGLPVFVTQETPGIEHHAVVGTEPDPEHMAKLLEAHSLASPEGA